MSDRMPSVWPVAPWELGPDPEGSLRRAIVARWLRETRPRLTAAYVDRRADVIADVAQAVEHGYTHEAIARGFGLGLRSVERHAAEYRTARRHLIDPA